ncbi:MAG: hypothetical protein HYR50_00365 [Candidatus Rokubacteria bacterium]|nr:hypothetical protein [Candidatus Rokubacteria bacterium]
MNTTLFCAIVGGVSAALVFLLLEAMTWRRWVNLSRADSLWLTALFAFGTVNWWMSTTGNVWFVAQVTTCACVALAVLLTVRRAPPALVGASLTLAIMGRPHVLAISVLILALAAEGQSGLRLWGRWALSFAWPVLLGICVLAVYNQQRFGSPTDFGYLHVPNLSEDGRLYGQFNLHFLPRNLWAMFLATPQWNAARGIWAPSRTGMSVLLTTPAFLWLLLARRPRALVCAAWLSLAVGLTPPLLYFTTGSWQFGSRFTLDVTIPVLVLLAFAMRSGLTVPFRAAVALSVVANVIGVAWWHLPR